MNSLIKLLSGISLLVIVGCASTPQLQKPLHPMQSNTIALFRSPILDQTAHTLQHLNKQKDILYYQTYGGGGAGLGLLAGPFGVAANIKMIESNTMKDVGILGGKINSDIHVLFARAAVAESMHISADAAGSGYKLNPYLLVEKTEGDQLMLAVVILLDTGLKFPNKYLLQLPVKYSIAELSSLSENEKNNMDNIIVDGYRSLIGRIKSESVADVLSERHITLKSEFLTPRFKFELKGSLIEEKNDIVWVRLVGSVCGVYSKDLEYTFVK